MDDGARAIMIVMRPESSGDELEAVRARARRAGLDADVLESNGRAAVGAVGALPDGLAEELRGLPGVEEVVVGGASEAPVTRDLRIESIRPLLPPAVLTEQLPLPEEGAVAVSRARAEVSRILRGEDDRLIVVVGPCSIHDPAAALEYARGLRGLAEELADDLCIVMRVYFEKPRTTVGWKGLINDPHLDNSFAVNDGLRLARQLLLDLVALGLPTGCEFLDPFLPQFFADAVTWGAIGARTVESQVHRNLASGLSMPVGFKNGTGGSVQIAIDGLRAAASPHSFLGVTEQGIAAIVSTRGNPDCHVILRGGRTGPNYDAASVGRTLRAMRDARLPARLMIDTSHDNSGKDYRRQPEVAGEIARQVAGGERGIIGVLMESFLAEGRQDLTDRESIEYGRSITDGCMGWDATVPVLRELAAAVRAHRSAGSVAPRPAEYQVAER